MSFNSTKVIELGSCAFRQPKATSHCRYIHGYRLTAKFWFESNTLDHNNWVVDFGSLKGLKKLLQQQFDHTTCISSSDPHISEFQRLADMGLCDLRIMDGVGIEKFAEWCHNHADKFVGSLTNMRARCVKVEVFEHESNSAIYQTSPSLTKQDSVDVSDKIVKPVLKTDSVSNDTQHSAPDVQSNPGDNLWPKKQKNTWLSGETTWGF